MYSLKSKKLVLFPLSANQLVWLTSDFKKLENAINLEDSDFNNTIENSPLIELNNLVREAVISQVMDNPDQYMWYTHWLIIEMKSKKPVGRIWFNGEPDNFGKVYLGYYIDSRQVGKGYASESLACLKKWAFRNKSLKVIIADTDKNHIASQKVLEKNGFRKLEILEDHIRWSLKIS